MNIIFFVCDALRAYNLGCYGYDKKTSPEIDKIAQKGVRFSNAFSTINTTDPSLTTMFTGRHPLSHGILNHGDRVTDIEKSYTGNMVFLPEILRNSGFVTIGIDWLGRWHKRGYDFYGIGADLSLNENKTCRKKDTSSRHLFNIIERYLSRALSSNNYDWYYNIPSFLRKVLRVYCRFFKLDSCGKSKTLLDNPILSDSAALSDLAIEYIKKFSGSKPFFMLVHYWDNHIPYVAPQSMVNVFLRNYSYPTVKIGQILENFSGTSVADIINLTTRGKTPETIGEIMARYDASIKYVDFNIGRIYRFLEKANLTKDTLIIITSDHGESLNEHNIFFDHHGLYDPEIKVPLIIYGPGIPHGFVHGEFVQHFDIMPTILDILGISVAGAKMNGDSLIQLINYKRWNRDYIFAEESRAQRKRVIRDKDYKYVMALDSNKCSYCQKYHSEGDEFYDLRTDPQEKTNIIQSAKHKKYKEALDKFINSLDKPVQGGEATFEDEATINKRLESLGYL